ncbi:MAG: pilus assembly protein CpaB [Frankiales bacterium]|nr:pilus assembly protein CpaB [Frankiales bacterium]
MRPHLTSWLTPIVRHERLVAAVLSGVAVVAGLHAVQPPGARLVPVVAASHSLHGGSALTLDDLAVVRVPPAAVPEGALSVRSQAIGQVVAGPLRRGELLTDTRLLGRALLDAITPGSVAVPVRIADADSVALVRVGDRVDLVAVPSEGGAARAVGVDLTVITVPPPTQSGLGEGALIVVAASRTVAAGLAAASATDRVSVLVHGH